MPPLRARFHFLNITNLEAVRQGAKPELVSRLRPTVAVTVVCVSPAACSVMPLGPCVCSYCHQLARRARRNPNRPALPASTPRPCPLLCPLQQEVGPYVFQSIKVKRQVEFVRDGDAVRYHEYRYFRPLPELSNGSLDDPITTLNVPLVGELGAGPAAGMCMRQAWSLRQLGVTYDNVRGCCAPAAGRV